MIERSPDPSSLDVLALAPELGEMYEPVAADLQALNEYLQELARHTRIRALRTLGRGDDEAAAFDGHHIAIYLADFSGPYNKLMERGLITEESDQHQYRFLDVVDPDSGEALFRLEHEVRSMRHPMYARPLVNRNPAINNRNYVPGYQEMAWASA